MEHYKLLASLMCVAQHCPVITATRESNTRFSLLHINLSKLVKLITSAPLFFSSHEIAIAYIGVRVYYNL